jgi:hypothetical protein
MSGSITDARTIGGSALEAPVSAISWPAIFAGMFATMAVTLVLTALGSGFGLAWASPFSDTGPSAKTLTIVAVVWLIVVQWIASGVGGYLTGRLRTKWVGLHTHEVFFRDTAHGFLTWSVATMLGFLLIATASSALVGGGVRAISAIGAGAAQGVGSAAAGAASQGAASNSANEMVDYALDTLFRSPQPAGQTANENPADARAEAGRILARGIATGDVPAADRTYLAQLVSARTGIAQPDAQKRVDDTIAQVKAAEDKAAQAADAARKAAAKFSIFTAVSMLVGAFIACAAAALGGQQRDAYP